MKIVHVVVTDNFAGVESYVCDVSTELAERGHEVVVLGGETATMHQRLPAAVTIERVTSVVSAARAIRRHTVPGSIVHAHMTSAEIAAAVAQPWRQRSPIVSTRHFAHKRGSSAPARAAGRWAAKHITQQISISEFVAASIGEPSVVIPSGMYNRPFGPHDELLVLVAQRLENEKLGDVAVRAWADSRLWADGWRMIFAGRGSNDSRLKSLAEELGVGTSIEWPGFVDDLPEVMSRAAIFFATTPHEGLGMSVLEAMACGLPVVAAAAGGHLETAGAANPDLLFPPGDITAAATALRRLAEDEQLRQGAGLSGQETQRRDFELGAHVTRLVELYDSVSHG